MVSLTGARRMFPALFLLLPLCKSVEHCTRSVPCALLLSSAASSHKASAEHVRTEAWRHQGRHGDGGKYYYPFVNLWNTARAQFHVRFSCPQLPPLTKPAQNVYELRPQDIKVVMAMGDSITAGEGAASTSTPARYSYCGCIYTSFNGRSVPCKYNLMYICYSYGCALLP